MTLGNGYGSETEAQTLWISFSFLYPNIVTNNTQHIFQVENNCCVKSLQSSVLFIR